MTLRCRLCTEPAQGPDPRVSPSPTPAHSARTRRTFRPRQPRVTNEAREDTALGLLGIVVARCLENILESFRVRHPKHILLLSGGKSGRKYCPRPWKELFRLKAAITHPEWSLYAHDTAILLLPLEISLARLLLVEIWKIP